MKKIEQRQEPKNNVSKMAFRTKMIVLFSDAKFLSRQLWPSSGNQFVNDQDHSDNEQDVHQVSQVECEHTEKPANDQNHDEYPD